MKKIALISGKGGSGKTTLALTMSSLLSKSEEKVILIDCDFATHGATYFFEEQIPKDKGIISLWDVAIKNDSLGNGLSTRDCISVDNNFYFIPSIKLVTNDILRTDFLDSEVVSRSIEELIFRLEESQVEIAIFDCQAGYSSLLPSLLPHIDIVLMVMEPDKVSSSALRSLHAKIYTSISSNKIYQVFNKIDEEDKEFYEKITFGTFAINIGALLFDQSIRKAFAFSKIPNIENEAIEYGFQICELFDRIPVKSETKNRIRFFEKKLLKKKKEMELATIWDELSNQKNNNRRTDFIEAMVFAFIILCCANIFGFFYLFVYQGNYLSVKPHILEGLSFVVSILGLVIGLIISIKMPRSNTKELVDRESHLREEIDELNSEIVRQVTINSIKKRTEEVDSYLNTFNQLNNQ